MDASHVYLRALALGCFCSHISYPNLSEAADSVAGQLRWDKECHFSGVTKSGRVWRKVPESDARECGPDLQGPVRAQSGRQRQYHEWSGDSSVAARRTRDRKVAGRVVVGAMGEFSSPGRLCVFGLLFRYLFHTRVTAAARKRSRSFCESAGGRVVTAKLTCAPRYIERRGTKARIRSLFRFRALCFSPVSHISPRPFHPLPPHPLPARPSPPPLPQPPILHYLCGRKPYLTNFSQKSNHGQLQSRDGLTNGTSLYYIASVQEDHYFCVLCLQIAHSASDKEHENM